MYFLVGDMVQMKDQQLSPKDVPVWVVDYITYGWLHLRGPRADGGHWVDQPARPEDVELVSSSGDDEGNRRPLIQVRARA